VSSQILARLQVAAAAVLFSTGGVAIKATQATGWTVSGLRAGIAGVVLLLFLPGAAKHLRLVRVWVVAVPYAATVTMFVLSSKYTTAANAIFLQNTAPLYVLLLGPLLLKEAVRRRDAFYMGALVLGLLVIIVGRAPAQATASNPDLGNLLAVCGGVSWALTIVGMRWLSRDTSSNASLAAVIVGSLLALLVALPSMGSLGSLGANDWLLLGYLGVLQIGLAYVLLTRGMRVVSAFNAALLLLIDPVLTPLWVWLFLNEAPGWVPLIGGAVIIGASALHIFSESTVKTVAEFD